MEEVFKEADQLINGDRQQSYGNVTQNFNSIAQIWSAILKITVSESDVALCMAGLKIARESSKHKKDNLVDACGYLALAQKIENFNEDRIAKEMEHVL